MSFRKESSNILIGFLKNHIPGWLLLTIVFTPTVPKLAPLRFEDLLIGFSVFLILLFPVWESVRMSQMLRVKACLATIGFAGICGMAVGAFAGGIIPVGRDLMFIPQVIKYFLVFFIIAKTLADRHALKLFLIYVFISALGASLVAISQYWNLFGVNNWLTPFFFQRELALQQMQEAEMNFRVKGTMGNPNYFGYLLCWLTAWCLAAGIFCCFKVRTTRIAGLSLLGASALSMLLLQSRTSLVSFSLVVLIFFAWSSKRILPTVVLFSLVLLSMYGMVQTDMLKERGFGERLSLTSESTIRSGRGRIRDFVQPLSFALENPYTIPFGQGPAKDALRTDSHNGYTWMLQRFGIVGLSAYLLLFAGAVSHAWRILRNRTGFPEQKGIALAVFLTCIPWFFGDVTGNIFKDPRLMSLNMIALGALQLIVSRRFEPVTVADGLSEYGAGAPCPAGGQTVRETSRGPSKAPEPGLNDSER